MPHTSPSRWFFRFGLVILGAWTLAAIIYSVVLAGQHGHPPGPGYVPLVGMAWAIGSVLLVLFLLLIAMLLTRDPA